MDEQNTPPPTGDPDMPTDTLSPVTAASPVPVADPPCHRINSETLLRGQNKVVIEHAGQSYILRLTRENKLILTK